MADDYGTLRTSEPQCRDVTKSGRGAPAERGVPHEVYRYDAGHGSLVDDERVRQMRAELDFAARHLPPSSPLPR